MRSVTIAGDRRSVIATRWRLFDGRAGEDAVQVWLEPTAAGVILRTQECGDGVAGTSGFVTVETSLTIGRQALFTLAFALVMDRLDLDPTAPPLDVLATAFRGDAEASASVRRRLEDLGLPYEFGMR